MAEGRPSEEVTNEVITKPPKVVILHSSEDEHILLLQLGVGMAASTAATMTSGWQSYTMKRRKGLVMVSSPALRLL